MVCIIISNDVYGQQKVPYKTLDSISAAIRKMQSTVNNVGVHEKYSNGQVKYDDTTIYRFPEDNFGVLAQNHLAYKVISSQKKGGTENYRFTDNIDLTTANAIFWRLLNDSTICAVHLEFPEESLDLHKVEGEKIINKKGSGLVFWSAIKDKKPIRQNSLPSIVQLIVKLYHFLCIEKGLMTAEQAAQELKDFKSSNYDKFLADHPNSLFKNVAESRKYRMEQSKLAPVAASSSQGSSLSQEISKLFDLKKEGILTEAEFAAAKAKLLSAPAKKESVVQASVVPEKNKSSSKNVISFSHNGSNYCAVKAPVYSEFIGLYEYPGNEPVFWGDKRVGEPIVKLDATERENGRSGKFQVHGIAPFDILWWLESDCNGIVKVINGELGDRYSIVIQYLTGNGNYPVGSFDRLTLDEFKNGTGKIVILGEREKVK